MKKKISVLLTTAVLCVTASACGSKDNQETSQSAALSSVEEATQTGETAAEGTAEGSALDVAALVDGLETMTLQDVTASDYVKLGDYEGVTVEVAMPNTTDEDVENYINNTLAVSYPNLVEVTDRAVEDGDTVNIDYVGKYADTKEAFDGGTAQGADLVIGSGSYIEGFESGLIGANLGDTVDLNLTFPEDYGATDLAGKDVIFTVTINKISANGGDLDDEWAKNIGYEGVETLDQLRAHVKKTLSEDAEKEYMSELENAVVDAVTADAQFSEMPEKLVNRFMQEQSEQLSYYANMYSYYYGQQLSSADVLSMMVQSNGFEGNEEEYLKKLATDMTNQFVMFQAIADEQGISITDEDIDAYLKDKYESASSTAFSSFEEFKSSLDLEIYREGLMSEEVVAYLASKANVVEPAE